MLCLNTVQNAIEKILGIEELILEIEKRKIFFSFLFFLFLIYFNSYISNIFSIVR